MTNEEVMSLLTEMGQHEGGMENWVMDNAWVDFANRVAALVAATERNKVAQWMIDRSYATGHGDTVEDLLQELEWQIAENWTRGMVNGVEAEREACARICEDMGAEGYGTLAIAASMRQRREA